MPNPLFARYSQGENRVTASILAVFERISFALVERILQILSEEPNIPLLEIRNQIKLKGASGVPDGAIQASFAYWIETKVVQNAIELDHQLPDGSKVNRQINSHFDSLEKLQNTGKKKLLVLTPDYEEPKAIRNMSSDLVVWASFNDLYSAIAEITATDESWLASNFSPPSEQERFLLRELVQMLLAEGLVNNGKPDSVLIVPARSAIYDYKNFSVYLCQPNRSFQQIEYVGFYHDGLIDRHIAKILHKPIEEIDLTEEAIAEATELDPVVKPKLQQLVDQLKNHNSFRYGAKFKVFFLSPPNSLETVRLSHDIRNDLKSSSGRPTAFVQGQRYVSLTALKKNPATTTELLSSQGV